MYTTSRCRMPCLQQPGMPSNLHGVRVAGHLHTGGRMLARRDSSPPLTMHACLHHPQGGFCSDDRRDIAGAYQVEEGVERPQRASSP